MHGKSEDRRDKMSVCQRYRFFDYAAMSLMHTVKKTQRYCRLLFFHFHLSP